MTADDARLVGRLGVLLVFTWLVYPILNIVNYFIKPWGEGIDVYFSPSATKIFSSQLPSSWLASGVFLLVISKFSRDEKISIDQNKSNFKICFNFWLRGLTIASLVFLVYALFQYFTGFDFRRIGHSLGPQNLVGNHYRIFGLYGHTLSVSSVGLLLFTFFWYLLFLGRVKLMPSMEKYRLYYDSSFFILAAINLCLVIMGGGRTSTITALAIFAFFPLLHVRKKFKKSTLLFWGAFSLIVMVSYIFFTSGGERILRSLDLLMTKKFSEIDARFVFWRIHLNMFLDSPFLGIGASHLKYGARDAYYALFGLEHFYRKYNAHNIYLEVLADIGILGTSLLGLSFFQLWKTIVRLIGGDKFLTVLWYALLSSIAANAIHGLTQNVFYDANVVAVYLNLFWIFLWLILLKRSRQRSEV
ncbi:MAG: O-antigen ligase family protein [Bdellovibrionota bacterium]